MENFARWLFIMLMFCFVLVLVAAIFGCSPGPYSSDLENSRKVLVDPIVKCVVTATVEREGAKRTARHFGTGFFVDKRGVIVTAAHVIEGHKGIEVYLSDRPSRARRAKVLEVDYTADIALLKVRGVRGLRIEPLVFCREGQLNREYTAYAWRRDHIERTSVHMEVGVPMPWAGRYYWYVEGYVWKGFSGGPIYDHDEQCVAGITSGSFLHITGDPIALFVRPESSKIIMDALEKYAPESVPP